MACGAWGEVNFPLIRVTVRRSICPAMSISINLNDSIMITATYVRCTLARLTPTDSVCPCCVACCSHAGGDALHLQVLELCYGNRQKHMSAVKRLMYVSYTAIPCLALRIMAGFLITFCTVTPVFGTCPAMSCR